MGRDRYDDIIDAMPVTLHQQRARDTVRRILTVTEEVIAAGDIDRFTTADIVAAGGGSIGTIYRYFTDRVAILDALYPDRHKSNDRLAAVTALHCKQDRWERDDSTGSFESQADADEWDDYPEGEAARVSFAICAECGRIEAEANEDAGADDWGYRESLWPCATARALGEEAR